MSKIYVASSWRNKHQQDVVVCLRSAGHTVYDFKNPVLGNQGFHWQETGFDPNNCTSEEFRRALNHPVAVEGWQYDFTAMQECDVCVLVLPAGRSASFELGWCQGAGKAGIVLLPSDESFVPELMYRGATIVLSFAEMLDAL